MTGNRRYAHGLLAQRRPFAIHSFSLNRPDLALAYFETHDDETARLSYIHSVILCVHKGEEEFLAPSFRKLIEFLFLNHRTFSSEEYLPQRQGMIPRSFGRPQVQLGPSQRLRFMSSQLRHRLLPGSTFSPLRAPCMSNRPRCTDNRLRFRLHGNLGEFSDGPGRLR